MSGHAETTWDEQKLYMQRECNRLLAENQRLKDEAKDMVLAAGYHEMRVLRDAAVAENQRLRDALEFYAERVSDGIRAREALAGEDGG